MTIRGHQVIGLKVYTLRQGKRVDKIEDVLFDPLTQKVAGFVVGPKRLLAENRAIPLTAVRHIGPDAVLVEDDRSIRPDTELPARLAHLAKSEDQLIASRVISQTGADLGYIHDLIFDFPEGQITSFVVSPKHGQADRRSTAYISPSDIQTIGTDATIVSHFEVSPPASKEQPEQGQNETRQLSPGQPINRAGEAYIPVSPAQPTLTGVLGGEVAKTAAGSPQAVAAAKKPTAPIDDQRALRQGGQVADLVAREREVSHSVGAYLTKNLISPIDDSLIARRGDMITYTLIDQAHQMGIDQQIFNFTSEEPIDDVSGPSTTFREGAPGRARKPLYPSPNPVENISH